MCLHGLDKLYALPISRLILTLCWIYRSSIRVWSVFACAKLKTATSILCKLNELTESVFLRSWKKYVSRVKGLCLYKQEGQGCNTDNNRHYSISHSLMTNSGALSLWSKRPGNKLDEYIYWIQRLGMREGILLQPPYLLILWCLISTGTSFALFIYTFIHVQIVTAAFAIDLGSDFC
jgi:hypothetical protein